ncbi:MAG TPA: DNA-processing protein DprA [Acidimicrobiia bacterium]|nr:DNA-processing protein DprA [Acidimicrobiia bacterium]
MSDRSLPDEAWLAALAHLPAMWPTRLAALLGLRRGRFGDAPAAPARTAADAWRWLRDGHPLDDARLVARCQPTPTVVVETWRAAAADTDPARLLENYRAAGVRLRVLGTPGYPAALASDHAAPYLVTTTGDPAALDHPRVAIIGTRRCTPMGRDVATDFGRELALAGVTVVSGLALGIDGAAHLGALSVAGAPPVGIVAGGLNRPYPTRHRNLWRQVAMRGLLVSEAPLGTPNEAWRFPARNRILAALADVVVVVESHAGGGSMITAEQALDRDKPVLAVPGPIRSAASTGTNRLLREGAGPACDTADILIALGLATAGAETTSAGRGAGRGRDPRPRPGAAAPVLAAVDWAPTSTETVLVRTGLGPSEVSTALALLEIDGWVRALGGWWERVGPDAPVAPAAMPTVDV